MYKLYHNGKGLDLTKFEGVGVSFEREETNYMFENYLSKVPGGKIRDYGSSITPENIQIEMVTANISKNFIDEVTIQIRDFCTDYLGKPKIIRLYDKFDIDFFREVKLNSVNTNYTTEIATITIVFNVLSEHKLSNLKTDTKSGQNEYVFIKEGKIGTEFELDMVCSNVSNIEVKSFYDDDNHLKIKIPAATSRVTVFTDRYRVKIDGIDHIIFIPSKFKFYKKLQITKTGGSINSATLKYREVK